MKKLKLFNGRGHHQYKNGIVTTWEHLYIAAYSINDAAELLQEVFSGTVNSRIYEINIYYNKNCWGVLMEDIIPERGIWGILTFCSKPIRIL